MDEEDLVPIIFGRPFLATARTVIDVHEGKLSLRVRSEVVTFNTAKLVQEQWVDTVDHDGKWIEAEEERDPKEVRVIFNGIDSSSQYTIKSSGKTSTDRPTRKASKPNIPEVLQGAKLNYLGLEKLILALVHATRRLQRRIAKWAIKLREHDIEFKGRDSVKGQIPADFLSKTPLKEDNKREISKLGTRKEGAKMENMHANSRKDGNKKPGYFRRFSAHSKPSKGTLRGQTIDNKAVFGKDKGNLEEFRSINNKEVSTIAVETKESWMIPDCATDCTTQNQKRMDKKGALLVLYFNLFWKLMMMRRLLTWRLLMKLHQGSFGGSRMLRDEGFRESRALEDVRALLSLNDMKDYDANSDAL
ncbi:hypothetical protein Tco_0206448 [Tanacetum coccineum]